MYRVNPCEYVKRKYYENEDKGTFTLLNGYLNSSIDNTNYTAIYNWDSHQRGYFLHGLDKEPLLTHRKRKWEEEMGRGNGERKQRGKTERGNREGKQREETERMKELGDDQKSHNRFFLCSDEGLYWMGANDIVRNSPPNDPKFHSNRERRHHAGTT
jgi:hypothetical protein